MKYIVLIFLAVNLFAVEFKESRYIEALGITTHASGQMNVKDEIVTLNYEKPQIKTMVFKSDSVKNSSDMGMKTFTYEQNPKFEYIYKLMQAIYLQKYEIIKPYFKIKQQKNVTTFEPLELTAAIFKEVVLQKNKNDMILKIFMNNGDRITIESTI